MTTTGINMEEKADTKGTFDVATTSTLLRCKETTNAADEPLVVLEGVHEFYLPSTWWTLRRLDPQSKVQRGNRTTEVHLSSRKDIHADTLARFSEHQVRLANEYVALVIISATGAKFDASIIAKINATYKTALIHEYGSQKHWRHTVDPPLDQAIYGAVDKITLVNDASGTLLPHPRRKELTVSIIPVSAVGFKQTTPIRLDLGERSVTLGRLKDLHRDCFPHFGDYTEVCPLVCYLSEKGFEECQEAIPGASMVYLEVTEPEKTVVPVAVTVPDHVDNVKWIHPTATIDSSLDVCFRKYYTIY